VNPLDFLPLAVVRLADFRVAFLAGFLSAIPKHLRAPNESQPLDLRCDHHGSALLDADQVARRSAGHP
jgi:hypothetical protein